MTTLTPPIRPELLPSAGGSGFDPASLSDIGDPDTQATLVSMFLEQVAVDLPELRQAIDAVDTGRVDELCHDLKGSAPTVGARRMSELCAVLDGVAASDISREGLELAPELIDAVMLTGAAMNAYIDEIMARPS